MDWNEFCERYLSNKEEFRFKYRDYIIDLLYSPNGEAFTYYISHFIESKNLFQNIKLSKKNVESKTFDSPEELIENFLFDGKSFKEIWDELEWK